MHGRDGRCLTPYVVNELLERDDRVRAQEEKR
jgi:hypothetical protein